MSLSLRQRVGLELQRKLRKNSAQLHPLRTLFWECTLRCNMNCRHCGSDCKVEASVPDMPAEDFLRAIDALAPHVDPNKLFVIFTGGEALLRNDLDYVGMELYKRGFPWGVVTNAFLLSEQRLESLVECGMHSMSVSLDGFAEQHDWIRRHKDAFGHAVDVIKLLADRHDVLWDVVTCVSPRNIDVLLPFKDFLVSIGVKKWRIFSIFPMGRAASEGELLLSDKQLKGLLDFIEISRKTDGRISVSYACEGFLGQYEGRVRDHLFFCRSGIEVASIRCDGSISGCTSVRSQMSQGNIYTDDLWDVWQNGFANMRNREHHRKGQCSQCNMWRYCEGSGLHLYDDNDELLMCHYHRLNA
ncbi:MAG: TIGR04133 family radical SAM/SPASM protein [Bacteroidales bacterium]|nr:TIGR04133 family radical SAM/SPASM protein [Bacteroidales bacterium]